MKLAKELDLFDFVTRGRHQTSTPPERASAKACGQKHSYNLSYNVMRFMVGTRAEKESTIKKGSQFVSAVSCSKVLQVSVILGSSYGAGNYAMCGRAN